MKLNVGCGDHYADGWMNIDLWRDEERGVTPDMIGSLVELPPEVQDVGRVYMGHVLEHLPYSGIVPALRSLWKRCMMGTTVAAVGPDVKKARAMYMQGDIDAYELSHIVNGERRWWGDAHQWECTGELMKGLLRDAGLQGVRIVPLDAEELNPFPVVSRVRWQSAVIGVLT